MVAGHLFLDLDNTLVGTEDLILPVFLEILKKDYAIELSEDDFYTLFLGKAGKHLYRAIAAHFSVVLDEDTLLAKQQEANDRAIKQRGFDVAPGLLDALRDLKARGWQMSIVSNSAEDKIYRTLDHMKGDPQRYLKAIVEGRIISCYERQKPDPYGYLAALEMVGARADEHVYCVEDSASGAQAGVAAGLPVFGFTGFARDKNKTRMALIGVGCMDVFERWADFSLMLDKSV